MELHSTILIDKKGRVYRARFGGDPFGDSDYLIKQLERMNEIVQGRGTDRIRGRSALSNRA